MIEKNNDPTFGDILYNSFNQAVEGAIRMPGSPFGAVGNIVLDAGKVKTNPYAKKSKEYEDLSRLDSEFENTKFKSAAGQQFNHAQKLGIFKNIKNIDQAKDINTSLRKNLKQYAANEKELQFIKEFLGVANAPIKVLQNTYELFKNNKRNPASIKEIYDDIGINLSKSAAHELLIENALNVYRSFPESKQGNIKGIKNELTRIYKMARLQTERLLRAEKNYGVDENNKVMSVENFNEYVKRDKSTIVKFSNENKLGNEGLAALTKFYEAALMSPVRIPSKYVKYRIQNAVFGSKEITNTSKKNFLDKFQDIYNRIPEGTAEGLPKEFIKPITTDSRELVFATDKAMSNTSKVGKVIKGKNFKVEDLDFLAREKSDYAELKLLGENLKKNEQIDSLNEFFIDFTGRMRGINDARDLSTATINDIKAINEYFKFGETGSKGRFKWVNWLIDPRTISSKELQPTIRKYEGIMTNYKSIKGTERAKVARYMTPLEATREFIRQTLRFQNATVDKIKNDNINLFDFHKYGLSKNDKQHIMNHISNRRNPEPENTLTKEDNAFLNKKFKGKTGKELVEEYNNKYTEFVKNSGKLIYTYNKKGNRIDFEIEIDNNKNPSFGKLNDYIHFSKDGKFDQNNFIKKVLRPVTTGKEPPIIGIESLLRYQYESIMERKLQASGKDNLAGRQAYRQKNKFRDFAFGYVTPEQYFPRTNYGYNKKAKREMELDINRLVKEGKDSYENLFLFTENTRNNSARVEDNFLNMQYELGDKNYKDVGYKSKPKNLLQRGEEFIRGYDKRPEIIDRYREQITRSYYANLMAIYGNMRIQEFKKTKDLDKGLTEKQKAALKKAGYENNTDVWSDFLYIYLKNSLGHPSMLTDRIQKSISKGDPLKLKNNPYYLTTDYAITRALEKMYKNDKINKLPFMRNAPEDPKSRRDYFVRRIHELGQIEAKYNLLTLLANTGSMSTNLYGGAVTTMGSASFRSFVDSKRNSVVTERLLQDSKGNFVLKFKNGKTVKNRKDLKKYLAERGVIDSYIANEFEYNEGLKSGVGKLGKDAKNFIRDLKASIKRGDSDESMLQLAERYGIKDTMLKSGGWFMSYGERVNRVDAFLAHALKAQERLGPSARNTNLNDPYLFDAGLKGVETTQFLYHNAFRPAFMTTALGKVLTRFKLFAFQSVRTRKEFYNQAKSYGFKQGTPEYERFKDLFLTDLFAYAMAGAFMYSVFDTALPPPWDWMQDTSDLLFGDKKERDRAFYGTLPRPIAPLQVALPPIARFPQTFVELIQGDWEKFSDYTVHTMYPFGRIMYATKKSLERPERTMHNFFRLPTDKIAYRIKREEIRDARERRIEEFFDA